MPAETRDELIASDDEDLMAKLVAAGGRDDVNKVFDEVFRRYNQRVTAWCYRVTRDRETAGDLAQEVFLKAFRHSASFRGDAKLSTWLYSIARNHCLSAVKRRHEAMLPLESATGCLMREARAFRASQADERTELCARLLRLMTRTLEPLEVRVMALHYGHDVSLAAITQQLSLTNPSGAKAYIVNARRKLNGIARRRGWHIALTGPPAWLRTAA